MRDELDLLVKENQLGTPLDQAILNSSERIGSPISQTLEIQAQDLRLKRRQHAEEQAMKLPVKLLFPMAFCILPVLLVIILAPAVINIFDTLG